MTTQNYTDEVLARLNLLDELLTEKESQTAPDALALTAETMSSVLDITGHSQNALAALLGQADSKNVRMWCAGRATPRRGAVLMLKYIVRETVIPPICDGAIGVTECLDALSPHLSNLFNNGTRAGWDEGEMRDATTLWVENRR